MVNQGFIKTFIKLALKSDEKIAISYYENDQIEERSYRDLVRDVLRCSSYFYDNAIFAKHIVLNISNTYDWIVVFFSVLASGNVVIPINADIDHHVLSEKYEQVDADMVILNEKNKSDYDDIAIEKRTLETIMSSQQSVSVENIYEAGNDETVLLICSSGTTGRDKVIECSSDNLMYMVIDQSKNEEKDKDWFTNRFLLELPLHHIGGINSSMTYLWYGRTLCLGSGFRNVIMDIKMMNPENVSLIPSAIESLIKYAEYDSTGAFTKMLTKHVKRITCIGAKMDKEVYKKLSEMGLEFATAYGMTETMGNGMALKNDVERFDSIGKDNANLECMIKNGELLLKGRSVIKGYYKDEEETKKVISDDGWLHTGDLGYVDSQGYYFISGRKKNVIILGNGENVNPEEIEIQLQKSETIEEVLVYSDGKKICADIFSKNIDEAKKFIEHYNKNVPTYHQVHSCNFFNKELEKTRSGKIKRK